jgi:hypothetical protein
MYAIYKKVKEKIKLYTTILLFSLLQRLLFASETWTKLMRDDCDDGCHQEKVLCATAKQDGPLLQTSQPSALLNPPFKANATFHSGG